jgi:hypothetical protein
VALGIKEERAMIDIKDKSVDELRELNWRRLLPVHDIPEYKVWDAMKQRCTNSNREGYRDYGGRGITVYEEWNKDFWCWFQHIGRRPIDGLTQERIDNRKGYEPFNVKWANYKTQNANQRPRTWHGRISRHSGVHWDPRSNKWLVRIWVSGQGSLHRGSFCNETDAAICWNYHCAYYGLDKPLNYIDPELYIHD